MTTRVVVMCVRVSLSVLCVLLGVIVFLLSCVYAYYSVLFICCPFHCVSVFQLPALLGKYMQLFLGHTV